MVPRGRVAVQLDAVSRGVVEPPGDLLVDAIGDLGRHGPLAEQLFGAEDLGRLAENHASAGRDEDVGGDAERRVGGDRRRGVAAAALEPERELAERHGLALELLERLGDLPMRSTIAATVALVPPSSWMLRCSTSAALPSRKFSGWFTSHPSVTTTTAARFGWVAYPRSVLRRSSSSVVPCAMPQPSSCASAITPSHDGIAVSCGAAAVAREPGDRRGAVDAREDSDVVARSDAPVRPHVAEEGL